MVNFSQQHLLPFSWDFELQAMITGTNLPPGLSVVPPREAGRPHARLNLFLLTEQWSHNIGLNHLYSHVPLFPLTHLSPSCIADCLPQPCHCHQSNSSWAGLVLTPLCQASSVSATATTTAAKLVPQKEDDSGDLMIHQGGDREGRQRISNITAESLASISAFHLPCQKSWEWHHTRVDCGQAQVGIPVLVRLAIVTQQADDNT